MAVAMIYPEPEKGGRGKKATNTKETLGFSAMRLSHARTVLRLASTATKKSSLWQLPKALGGTSTEQPDCASSLSKVSGMIRMIRIVGLVEFFRSLIRGPITFPSLEIFVYSL